VAIPSGQGKAQPGLFFAPDTSEPKPLLVALHTWSGDYTQANPAYAVWCIEKQWVMVHPNFRGINDRPEACGSEWVVQDILDAVDYARSSANIDNNRIYLIGASGGGYAALLMAGRAPDVWAGVSAWCPIFDLADWHGETRAKNLKYASMLEKVCDGAPGSSAKADDQYRIRSASHWLARAKNVRVCIQTGIADGHQGSVPVSHTLHAFNELANDSDRISASDIKLINQRPEMPPSLQMSINDPLYGSKSLLFRKQSANVQVTLFQGGHEIVYLAGLAWLEKQSKNLPAVWTIDSIPDISLEKFDTKSGK
jgi:dienelactone hydrolase